MNNLAFLTIYLIIVFVTIFSLSIDYFGWKFAFKLYALGILVSIIIAFAMFLTYLCTNYYF